MKNTKEGGRFRIFIYPYKGEWVAVCPEFGIIEREKEFLVLKKKIMEVAREHLEFVRKEDLPDFNLNRSVSPSHYIRFYFFLFARKLKNTEHMNGSYTGAKTSFA